MRLRQEVEIWDGRLIAAARALCGISSRELARLAGVSSRTVVRIEGDAEVQVSPRQRHGCVSQETWGKLVDVLAEHGVELVAATGGVGAGVRWRREAEATALSGSHGPSPRARR